MRGPAGQQLCASLWIAPSVAVEEEEEEFLEILFCVDHMEALRPLGEVEVEEVLAAAVPTDLVRSGGKGMQIEGRARKRQAGSVQMRQVPADLLEDLCHPLLPSRHLALRLRLRLHKLPQRRLERHAASGRDRVAVRAWWGMLVVEEGSVNIYSRDDDMHNV